jgi:hypothetical protein
MYFDKTTSDISVLSSPKIALNERNVPTVVGHHGNTLDYLSPIGIDHDKSQGSILSFLPSSLLPKYQAFMDQKAAEDYTATVDGEDTASIQYLPNYGNEDKPHQAILPVALPLPFGHGLEGPYDITNPEIRQRLRIELNDIHPFYGHWIDAMTYMIHSCAGFSLDHDELEVSDDALFDIPDKWMKAATIFTDTEMLANSSDLAKSVISDLEVVKIANFGHWWENNKTNYPDVVNKLNRLLQPVIQTNGPGAPPP